jgi:homoserine kinase type II
MRPLSLDSIAHTVIAAYPAFVADSGAISLGNHGGFSGAAIWRLEGAAGTLCLRAWPTGDPTPERLNWIHALMDQAWQAGLRFVPALIASRHGTTWSEHAGRLWEVTTWQPGRADYHGQPTRARLEAACLALARLHAAWAGTGGRHGACPAIERRLARTREWDRLIRSGWRPSVAAGDPIAPSAERVWQLLGSRLDWLEQVLRPHSAGSVALQPCLCDVWHDHVLFEGDAVTGLIDYGSVKVDHVAVDLARLLGSLVGDDKDLWAAGLGAYRGVQPLSADEEKLVGVLDETGTLLGAANWLRWLYRDGRSFEDRTAIARRLTGLLERLEHCP